ncbi:unnamed protein product [Pedinophyceae sp. YPF-701]|nr:unnamed protein product [Pedinophyceae sp. YPF-701]
MHRLCTSEAATRHGVALAQPRRLARLNRSPWGCPHGGAHRAVLVARGVPDGSSEDPRTSANGAAGAAHATTPAANGARNAKSTRLAVSRDGNGAAGGAQLARKSDASADRAAIRALQAELSAATSSLVETSAALEATQEALRSQVMPYVKAKEAEMSAALAKIDQQDEAIAVLKKDLSMAQTDVEESNALMGRALDALTHLSQEKAQLRERLATSTSQLADAQSQIARFGEAMALLNQGLSTASAASDWADSGETLEEITTRVSELLASVDEELDRDWSVSAEEPADGKAEAALGTLQQLMSSVVNGADADADGGAKQANGKARTTRDGAPGSLWGDGPGPGPAVQQEAAAAEAEIGADDERVAVPVGKSKAGVAVPARGMRTGAGSANAVEALGFMAQELVKDAKLDRQLSDWRRRLMGRTRE